MTVDHTQPTGKWAFNSEVTACFDDMLSRSIPEYAAMRKVVFDVGSTFVKPDTFITDLGCSRGEALAPFVDRFGSHNRFCGTDVSEPMLTASRERFAGWIKIGAMSIDHCDLRTSYPAVRSSLTLAVLTLQFTPIEYRQRIIKDIYKHTIEGGALILVEKVLGHDAETDGLLVKQYHALKRDHGYSQDDIDRKRLALEGVLVPVTAAWNQEMLNAAGFSAVECIWRHLNFAAWVAIK